VKKSHVSLKDIAKELNLSISTVSRAIRNTGEISPETRKAVLELAEKWNYKPNPLAMGLLKNKTNTIGIIIPDAESYYYSSILSGIDRVAAENNYSLLTCYTNDNYKNEIEAIDKLLFSRVEGIISCPASETSEFLYYNKLIDDKFPLILVDRRCKDIKTTTIVTDNYRSAFELTEHLITEGCRRIALITSFEPLSVGRQRFDAYKDALLKHNIPFKSNLIIHGNLNISTSIEATRNLLKLPELPDAIIGNDDTVAMAAMKVIKESGLKIPENIALAGFNDDPFSSFLEPALTTVGQPGYLMGLKAIDKMLLMISGDIAVNLWETIVMDSALVIRESTKK
jgi:DNA-binding LacI/PurR family transcriptional regulator